MAKKNGFTTIKSLHLASRTICLRDCFIWQSSRTASPACAGR